MYKIAVGTLGLQPEYFLNTMSLAAFQLASEGYYDRRREDWEQTRVICYNSVSPYMKKAVPLTKFMPFDWDKKEAEPLTEEQKKEHKERALKQFPDLA